MRKLALALLCVFLCSSVSLAQSQPARVDISQSEAKCGVCQGAESMSWAKSAPGKILRGIVNAGLGWTNLIAQPIRSSQDGDNVFKGIGKGFGYTVLRTVQGVAEIVIFWLPPSHEEPLRNCALGDMGITGR